MKTLIFVRHGRATEKGPHIDDRSRPTIAEGDAKTHANALHMKHEVKTIDAIISSGARRAKMTAEVVAKVYGIDRNAIHYDAKLRTDDREDISDIIPGLMEKRDTVVLVGHNPTITDVADHYTKHEGGHLKKSAMIVAQFSAPTRSEVAPRTYHACSSFPRPGHHSE